MNEPYAGLMLHEENPAELRKRILGLETILELTRSLMIIQDRNRLDNFLLLTVMGLLSVSRAILLTRDLDDDRFHIHAKGIREKEMRLALGLRPSGVFARRMRIVRDRVAISPEGLPEREMRDMGLLRRERIRYAVPIRAKEKLNGILLLGERVHTSELSHYESDMLRSILDIAGIVMENADLYEEMRRANRSMEEQNDRLKEMDKLKTQFLSNVGHELRTPLTSVIGFAECLRYPEVEDEDRIEFAGNIIHQSERLTNLIEQVLDLSEFSNRAVSIRAEEGDINDLIDEVVRDLQADVHHKNITMDVELSPSLPPTHFDPVRTKRVIQNLLDNAIKFSNRNGSVSVKSIAREKEVVVTVSDDGVGIPPGALPTIFDPFRQADGSDTRMHGGVGIGLSLVKEIVESQKGSVSVSSRPGKGSVFTVRLPLNAGPGAATTGEASLPVSPQGHEG